MNNIVVYENGELELKVSVEKESIWATQRQIAELFATKVPAINKHIKNIFLESELNNSTISKMEIVQTEGKRKVKREVEFYNLDMIIAVGYRVNSKKATQFRIWATNVLKEYIYHGYAINSEKITHQRFKELESDVSNLKNDMQNIKSKVKDDSLATLQGIFYNGEIYDAYVLINNIFKSSHESIILIDNYIDDTILTLFSKYPKLNYTVITQKPSKQLSLDIKKYNSQYHNLKLKISTKYQINIMIDF
ncbi:MAG: RhuM family protein [Sulfurovum sp.]|nr:RhuM family protein [Sulfurovum sp.]